MSTPTSRDGKRAESRPTPEEYITLFRRAQDAESMAHPLSNRGANGGAVLEEFVAQRVAEAVGPLERKWQAQYALTCDYIDKLTFAQEMIDRDLAMLKHDLSSIERGEGPDQPRIEAEKTRLNQAIGKLELVRQALSITAERGKENPLVNLESARASLAALVVRLKEALWAHAENPNDPAAKALKLVPADLADKVLVRAIDAAVIDDNGRLERANAALEADNRALREALSDLEIQRDHYKREASESGAAAAARLNAYDERDACKAELEIRTRQRDYWIEERNKMREIFDEACKKLRLCQIDLAELGEETTLLRQELENTRSYSETLKLGLSDIAQGRYPVGTVAAHYARKVLYPNKAPKTLAPKEGKS